MPLDPVFSNWVCKSNERSEDSYLGHGDFFRKKFNLFALLFDFFLRFEFCFFLSSVLFLG